MSDEVCVAVTRDGRPVMVSAVMDRGPAERLKAELVANGETGTISFVDVATARALKHEMTQPTA